MAPYFTMSQDGALHTSAKMTLDTYADLFDDDLDAVAVTLHARFSRPNVGKMWAPRGHEGR